MFLLTWLDHLSAPSLIPCCVVCMAFCRKTVSDNLQQVQNYAMRVVSSTHAPPPSQTNNSTCLQLLA